MYQTNLTKILLTLFTLFVVITNGKESLNLSVGLIQDPSLNNTISGKIECELCVKVIEKIEDHLAEKTCTVVTKLKAVAFCELVGIGPEDPLADMCVILVWKYCTKIVEEIAKGIKDPIVICKFIKMCPE